MREVRQFWGSRIARIWPMHILTALAYMAVFSVWFLPVSAHFPWVTLANLCLVQAWILQPASYLSLNTVSWSVSAELFFYLMFPLIVRNWAKTWHLKLVGSGIVVAGFCAFSSYHRVQHANAPIPLLLHTYLYINPFARIAEFILGMTAALFFVKRKECQLSVSRASFLELLIFLIVGLNLFITPYLISRTQGALLGPLPYWLQYTSGAPLCAALITILAFQSGVISKLLCSPLLVFLGEISYSVYLIHWIAIRTIMGQLHYAGAPLWKEYFLYWLTVLLLSTLSYLYFEKPCRLLLKKILCGHSRSDNEMLLLTGSKGEEIPAQVAGYPFPHVEL
jgi:peptidoglycan/LPS O-acetylase OafA/YrhL